MPTRVIALFIAFVVGWSSLSSIEAPRVLVQSSPEQQVATAHGSGQAAGPEGSVEHHHLDDLPSQAQSDPQTETAGLLPEALCSGATSLAMSRPQRFVSAAAGTPFLAGPLRPPCSATLAG